MKSLRRIDHNPRVEMMPLIDVVFLLLTFFIYSMIVMVHAKVLPVTLAGIGSGEAAEPARIEAITIDREGQLYLNRETIELDALRQRLDQFAADPQPPQVFLALQEQGDTDRGPLFVKVMEMIRESGIEQFGIVGPER